VFRNWPTNHLWIEIAIEQHTRNFLGVQELAFVMFSGLFFEFLTPFTLGAHNFLISNLFLTIVCVPDAPRGGVQVFFGHHKELSYPLRSSLP
jgi:hypothetical protein